MLHSPQEAFSSSSGTLGPGHQNAAGNTAYEFRVVRFNHRTPEAISTSTTITLASSPAYHDPIIGVAIEPVTELSPGGGGMASKSIGLSDGRP